MGLGFDLNRCDGRSLLRLNCDLVLVLQNRNGNVGVEWSKELTELARVTKISIR